MAGKTYGHFIAFSIFLLFFCTKRISMRGGSRRALKWKTATSKKIYFVLFHLFHISIFYARTIKLNKTKTHQHRVLFRDAKSNKIQCKMHHRNMQRLTLIDYQLYE